MIKLKRRETCLVCGRSDHHNQLTAYKEMLLIADRALRYYAQCFSEDDNEVAANALDKIKGIKVGMG